MLGDWFDPQGQGDQSDLIEELLRQDSEADGFLVGRRTFTDLRGYWPQQTDDTTGVTDYLNQVQKYVVSSTLTDPGWEPTTILAGDPVEEVRRSEERPTAGTSCAPEASASRTRSSGPVSSTSIDCSCTRRSRGAADVSSRTATRPPACDSSSPARSGAGSPCSAMPRQPDRHDQADGRCGGGADAHRPLEWRAEAGRGHRPASLHRGRRSADPRRQPRVRPDRRPARAVPRADRGGDTALPDHQ